MSEAVEREVEALAALDLDELREEWRTRFGPPPPLRSVSLLRLTLAWRIQALAYGGLKLEARRQLKRTGAIEAEGLALGVGARLRREWKGKLVEVEVEQRGFAGMTPSIPACRPPPPPSPARAGMALGSSACGAPAMKAPLRRCALYTRKSSEEGLDQEFNSLDAQREAAEAYVKSQASEGWRAIPTRYDDGGYSGGSMQRPALARIMADIAAGKVDVVVVYKIDRLTRSLADLPALSSCSTATTSASSA